MGEDLIMQSEYIFDQFLGADYEDEDKEFMIFSLETALCSLGGKERVPGPADRLDY